MAGSENQKQRRAERTRAFLEQLMERYPDCFSNSPEAIRPLAIGIQHAIRADLVADPDQDEPPGWLVRQALARYTRQPAYLDATIEGRNRVNLDGSDAGAVTDEAVAYAQERREEQKARNAERRKARQAEARRRAKAAREKKPQRPSPQPDKLDALARKFND